MLNWRTVILIKFLHCLLFLSLYAQTTQIELTQEENEWIGRHTVIKLAAVSANEPAIILEPGGTVKGIVPDYLQIIEDATGLSIELSLADTAAEAHSEAKLPGRYGHAMAVDVPANRERYIITNPYASSKVVVFTRKEDLQDIRDTSGLAGKAVAVPRGNAALIGYLKQLGNVQIVEAESPQDQMRMLQYREVDAIIGYITYHYQIQKSLFTDIFMAFETERALNISIGVNPEYEILASILNKGIASITEEIESQTFNKWLSYTARYTAGILLTPEEKRYLQELGRIRMCVDPDWMPYEQINAVGDYEGIIADYMTIFSERLGIPFELVPTENFRESMQLLAENRCDIFAANVATDEIRQRFFATEPYHRTPRAFAVHADSRFITDFHEIADGKIGVLAGSPAMTILPEIYPQCTPLAIDTTDEGLRKVAAKEIDAFVSVLGTISYSIQKQGLRSVKIGGAILSEVPLSVLVSKEHPELVPVLNKAIAGLTTDDHREITNRWITVIYEEGIDYSIIWKIMIGVAAVIGFLMYRHYAMRKINKRLQAAEAELMRKNEELNLLSMTDPLTGLMNRRAIEARIDMEMGRSNRFHFPVCLIVLDIDHFKQVNDRYGHDKGDLVLQGVAGKIRDSIRSTDSLARWGGEEFLLLVPDAELPSAVIFAEKLRKEIGGIRFDKVGSVTASFGVAAHHNGERFPDWFDRADRALYRAKKEGRNRVAADGMETGMVNTGTPKDSIFRIHWTNEFRSGFDAIDMEHKKLFEDGNKIIEAYFKNMETYYIAGLLDIFAADIQKHFKNEEQLLKDEQYPDISEQIESHEQLGRKLTELISSFEKGEGDPLLFLKFITQDLVVDHMLQVDKKFFK